MAMASTDPWIEPGLAFLLEQLTEAQVATVTLYGEARSEPIEGMVAVANVLRNRVLKQYRGVTYRDICLASHQFSCWNRAGGGRNHEEVVSLVRKFAGKQPIVAPVVRELTYLMHGVINDGWLRDTVKGACHYHVATMLPRPKWAQGVVPVCQRGSHVFYEGVK
jgi:N-acetylmuramoyl-L-alanine amidase